MLLCIVWFIVSYLFLWDAGLLVVLLPYICTFLSAALLYILPLHYITRPLLDAFIQAICSGTRTRPDSKSITQPTEPHVPTFWRLMDVRLCFLCFQTRKPLVEKKRRARINESLQELRTLLEDSDVSSPEVTWRRGSGEALLMDFLTFLFPAQLHSKTENAEVLEMTVKKVEEVLKNRSQGLHSSVKALQADTVLLWQASSYFFRP